MSAYVKKIAVIKQVKSGFSADGGNLSGLVKAETYAGFLKVEVSLINFAPLTDGRYVMGISDGLNFAVFDEMNYERECDFNLSEGFAFLVCFCHNTVAPIASAASGQMACALPDLKEEITRRENVRPKTEGVAYDDEAITEVNYYEQFNEGGAAVCKAPPQEESGSTDDENEEDTCTVQSAENGENGEKKNGIDAFAGGGEEVASQGGGERVIGGLAGGDFYSRMEGDIKRIFATYPKEEQLERAMEGSRFAKIAYGEGKHYVFGVLSIEGKPRYICYGVPATNPHTPPSSLKDFAGYVPTESGGYWMTYQDAATGVSIKIGVN